MKILHKILQNFPKYSISKEEKLKIYKGGSSHGRKSKSVTYKSELLE